MKTLKMTNLILLSTLLATNALAADCFSMGSGYEAGKFEVSVMGEKGGLVEAVIPILVAAGAKTMTQTSCPACPYTNYNLPDNSQSIMVRTPDLGIPGYQWNFNLAFTDGIQINEMGPGFQFSGPVAETIYRGLDAAKAKNAGFTPGADGQFNVPIYTAGDIGHAITCQKQGAKTSCSISLEANCRI